MSVARPLVLLALVLAAALAPAAPARAAGEGKAAIAEAATLEAADFQVAVVWVDGRPLFKVAGLASTMPAQQRADRIAQRIEELAADPASDASKLRIEPFGATRQILYGDRNVVVVTGSDAALLGIDVDTGAEAFRRRIVEAIAEYRSDRAPGHVRAGAARSFAALAVAAVLVALALWLARRADGALDRRYQHRIQTVGIQSFQILHADQIRAVLHRVISVVRVVAVGAVLFVLLDYTLALFPWTRRAGVELMSLGLDPLRAIGGGIVRQLPNVAFLAVLVVVVRYLLRLTRLFFDAVGKGRVTLHGFDAAWADPTYKLTRLVVVVFALVVAYPYIPGSQTDAFKGISIFLGFAFSLASTTAISNIVAGYALIYRGAFKPGDRIRAGDVVGIVTRSRLQSTHLKTAKNEEVIVPNAQLMGGTIVNYSSLAGKAGPLASVTAGIGYETPWRQVEAMLLLAAERTGGVSREPPPFVWHRELGDFCVNYELNVHVRDAATIEKVRTELSRAVLDVFNEYGVQIMTPNYVADPGQAKLVGRDDWYLPPAAKPDRTQEPPRGG